MRDLYYTTTRPKHPYKSEKVFSQFFRMRRQSNFGARARFSTHKKLLVLKKFFQWYYFIPHVRFFRKIFSRFFLRKRVTFRYLATFFFLLEANLLVLLVRASFAANLLQAFSLVKSELIFVNGFAVTRAFFTVRLGDIIESSFEFSKILGLIYWRRFLALRTYRKRYLSGIRTRVIKFVGRIKKRRRRRFVLGVNRRKRTKLALRYKKLTLRPFFKKRRELSKTKIQVTQYLQNVLI